jgi:fatty acid kinase fatty acid binding subunit
VARVAIVTDSTADLPADIRDAHNIAVVPLNIHFDREVLQDQIDITTNVFFARLQSASELPKTSQPSPGQFEAVFRSLAADHDGIVAILISSKLSDTVQSATDAANNVSELIPVEVVDSRNASLGLGFQVLAAVDLVAKDLSANQVAEQLRANVDAYSLVFFVDTLEYLQRGGRIGRAASLVGTLIRLKPILRVDEGQIVPYERTRTRSRAIDGLRSFVNSWPTPISRLGVLYATDLEFAQQFAAEFTPKIPAERIIVAQFSPVLGTHVGPGAMGVCIAESD